MHSLSVQSSCRVQQDVQNVSSTSSLARVGERSTDERMDLERVLGDLEDTGEDGALGVVAMPGPGSGGARSEGGRDELPACCCAELVPPGTVAS